MEAKRRFFLIGYWLVHISGIFPLKLKNSKKRARVTFHVARSNCWTPWTSSRRTCLLELAHVFVILYSSTWLLAWNAEEVGRLNWIESFLGMVITDIVILGKACVTVSCILTATIHRREIERLLNNVCSFYFTVFKRTDPPAMRKFAYLIVYAVLSFVATAVISIWLSLVTGTFRNIFWQMSYMFTLLYTEVIWGILLVYIQSAVEGLNREIKSRFPRVDEWDWKCWEPVLCREENQRREGFRTRAKSFLEEYRRTYRTVANIVDQLNSVYGLLVLITVLFNQVVCLILGFCYISILLQSPTSDIAGEMYWQMMNYAFWCAWCFVRISVIVHGYEIVVKEVQLTARYIASIDASEIDEDSKMELLEFLDEIDGRKIRFTAGNIFSLDYATLYLMLTTTVTYIAIVMQYLSP